MSPVSRTPKRVNSRRSSRLRVLCLVHTEFFDPSDPDFLNVTPDTESEHAVSAGLKALQHDVSVLAFEATPKELSTLGDQIKRLKPGIVFNFIEHLEGDRRRAAEIPALLDQLNIPYTGASANGTLAAIDKAGSKQAVSSVGFPVPSFLVVPLGAKGSRATFAFPGIVKPRFGGASVGLTLASVVNSRRDLIKRAQEIHRKLDEPAIC